MSRRRTCGSSRGEPTGGGEGGAPLRRNCRSPLDSEPRDGPSPKKQPIGGAHDAINHAILSGVVVEPPVRDRSREVDPVTILIVGFSAPDEKAGEGAACCEVEVLDTLADPHRHRLRPGAPILVSGAVTGAGGLWARFIWTGEAV